MTPVDSTDREEGRRSQRLPGIKENWETRSAGCDGMEVGVGGCLGRKLSPTCCQESVEEVKSEQW